VAEQPGWETEGIDAQAWNFCWLGDDLLPGIVEVTSRKSRAIDKHKSKGTDGCFLEDEGYEGGSVTIRLTLINAEQWQAYQDLLTNIDPEQIGGLKRPLSILHPEPNAKGITTVYVTEISGGHPSSASGKVEVIECEQYFPVVKPKKTSKNPKERGKEGSEIVIPPDLEVNTF
jgi:hypothetical protein